MLRCLLLLSLSLSSHAQLSPITKPLPSTALVDQGRSNLPLNLYANPTSNLGTIFNSIIFDNNFGANFNNFIRDFGMNFNANTNGSFISNA